MTFIQNILNSELFTQAMVIVLAAIFTWVATRINKNQTEMMQRMDDQTINITREADAKQKVVDKEKEKADVMERITVLSLRLNMMGVRMLAEPTYANDISIAELVALSEDLQKEYDKSAESLRDAKDKYKLVADMTKEFIDKMQSMSHIRNKKRKK